MPMSRATETMIPRMPMRTAHSTRTGTPMIGSRQAARSRSMSGANGRTRLVASAETSGSTTRPRIVAIAAEPMPRHIAPSTACCHSAQPSSESGAFPTARAQRRKAVAVEPLDALVLEPCGRPQRIHERHEEEESDPDDEHEAQPRLRSVTSTEKITGPTRPTAASCAIAPRWVAKRGRRDGTVWGGGCGADHGSTVGAGRAGHSGGIRIPASG
jgi:hypothetical protein